MQNQLQQSAQSGYLLGMTKTYEVKFSANETNLYDSFLNEFIEITCEEKLEGQI